MKILKILLLFSIIYIIFILYNNHYVSKYDMSTTSITGVIINVNIDSNKTTLEVLGKEKIIIRDYNNFDYKIGDTYTFFGNIIEVSDNTNFNLFNYKTYLLSNKIYYTFTASARTLLDTNTNILYSLKQSVIDRINSYKCSNYLHTFILGDSSYLSDEIISSYQKNGISHLFAVSGMHITLLSTCLFIIFKKIFSINFSYILVSLFLIFYLFLTSFSPSVLRAVLLFLFLYLNKLFKFDFSILQILFFIFILLLVYNPFYIYNLGFQFSFLISFALVYFSKIINNFNNYYLKILITSIISFLSSIPILITNFFEINLVTPFINVVFVPIVSLFLFPLSLITFIFKPLDIIMYNFLYYFENLSIFISNNFYFLITLSKNNIFIIIYIFLIFFILKKMEVLKYKYMILLFILFIIHSNFIKLDDSITFIDVSQGDSTLIIKDGITILVDTGGLDNYSTSKNIIIPYLKSIGIKKIDYLIFTHGDYDHAGSGYDFVSNFKVGRVFFNSYNDTEIEKEIMSYLDSKDISYYKISNELKLKHFTILNYPNEDENEDSLIIVTNINNKNILLMGDAGFETEDKIMLEYLSFEMDILKLGHHGSKNSTSSLFLNFVDPKLAISSAGKNNKFNHPSIEVINRLDDIPHYSTSVYGMIIYNFDKKTLYTSLDHA